MTQQKRPLIVLNVAGLSQGLIRSGDCPNLLAYAEECDRVPVQPQLPALTLSMQATYLTGQPPARHGIVGNGYFDRSYQEHRFWSASARLLEAPPLWQDPALASLKTATLFWWHCLGGGQEIYLNVAPIHTHSGETLSSCYSDPADFYDRLVKDLGPFPLHRFWGPGVSIESSQWILRATELTLEQLQPDLLLSYIPHMDYSLQRSGPDSAEARQHLRELDSLLERFLDRSRQGAFDLLILSEYGISPVSRAISLNRFLNQEGYFKTRTVHSRDYPDLVGSKAFAVCDHQVAHLYIKSADDQEALARKLSKLEGISRVLDRAAQAQEGVNHARTGDLLALAEPDAWFYYPWWDQADRAPDYAFTVDIHRKIGYDPLELILEPRKKIIASDPTLIRGSHGLVPDQQEDWPLLILPPAAKGLELAQIPLQAGSVKEVIVKLLAGQRKEF